MKAPVLWLRVSVVWIGVLSSLILSAGPASAHELRPSIADITITNTLVLLEIELTLEAVLAGIDLSAHDDTTQSPEAATYDVLRAEPPNALAQRFREAWPDLSDDITLRTGDTPVSAALERVTVPEVGDPDLPRDSRIVLTADLPADGRPVVLGWDARLGPLVVRQQGIEDGYTTYLTGGAVSDPIARGAPTMQSSWAVFADYLAIGFAQILPAGLDHILFALGLFFLSLKLRPLAWQIMTFALAHTIALILGSLGTLTLPAPLLAPLIAASLVYVGVENVLAKGLTPWRPVLVFVFGFLHGLGFASALDQVGPGPGAFVASLIGFNIGIDLGLLTVIGLAFLLVGFWFGKKPWYTARIANPASIIIAMVGAFWVVERTFL